MNIHKCYWVCMIPYNAKETQTVRNERRKKTREALKAGGYETEYKFHFNSDKAATLGAAAKVKAEKKAAEIMAALGIVMEVT